MAEDESVKVINSHFKIFGFQIDAARQIERPEVLYNGVKGMAECGYNVCQIYLEDAFQYPGHPGLSRANAYSVDDMKVLHRYCSVENIELIPVIPALGHCAYITNKAGYERYDEGRGTDMLYGTVSPLFPETYELLEDLFKGWCNNIPGKYLHVGLDESPAMGQYYIRHNGEGGFCAVRMFAEHCNKLNTMVKALGRRMVMWGDMFYHFPEAMDLIDKDIIIADWYYYTFDKMPRIESFNFKQIDSAGRLKKAGFEVWGTPSVWPNCPFADIEERYRNLTDWVRYGKAVGVDGIINTDWENSFGFYANSDLLFRVFGKLVNNRLKRNRVCGSVNEEDLGAILTAGIRDFFSSAQEDNQLSAIAVKDILALGKFTICAHTNKNLLYESPFALITSSPERKHQFKTAWGGLESLFSDLDTLNSCINGKNNIYLTAIKLSGRSLLYFWKTAHLVNVFSDKLNVEHADLYSVGAEIKTLVNDLNCLSNDYKNYWQLMRYGNDKQVFVEWCNRAIAVLEDWIRALGAEQKKHPVLITPRLEMIFTCKHPALPVVNVKLHWSDGTIQAIRKVMIMFESGYAVPEKEWRQYPVVVCDKFELPEKIELTNTHYGQTGVSEVRISWHGKRYDYRLLEVSGDNIIDDGETLWLGPVTGTADQPTVRSKKDKAWFVPVTA